jgi:phenol 2-monooxygenase
MFSPYNIEFVGELDWWGVNVVGQRLASAYQDTTGRVFILGDACGYFERILCQNGLLNTLFLTSIGHTHSPHAGQGMNAAMSDGHNLSWKLVHVLRGWAGPELLRTVCVSIVRIVMSLTPKYRSYVV